MDLKSVIARRTEELVDEAILNMESEEIIDSFMKITDYCKFENSNLLNKKIQKYKRQLKEIYVEGLKSKHAFLRTLVIANTSNDKLRQMKFTKRYNYPTLIWGSAFKSESDLKELFGLPVLGSVSKIVTETEIKNRKRVVIPIVITMIIALLLLVIFLNRIGMKL